MERSTLFDRVAYRNIYLGTSSEIYNYLTVGRWKYVTPGIFLFYKEKNVLSPATDDNRPSHRFLPKWCVILVNHLIFKDNFTSGVQYVGTRINTHWKYYNIVLREIPKVDRENTVLLPSDLWSVLQDRLVNGYNYYHQQELDIFRNELKYNNNIIIARNVQLC